MLLTFWSIAFYIFTWTRGTSYLNRSFNSYFACVFLISNSNNFSSNLEDSANLFILTLVLDLSNNNNAYELMILLLRQITHIKDAFIRIVFRKNRVILFGCCCKKERLNSRTWQTKRTHTFCHYSCSRNLFR